VALEERPVLPHGLQLLAAAQGRARSRPQLDQGLGVLVVDLQPEEVEGLELAIDVAGERYTKILYAGDRLDTRKLLSPIRTAPDFLTQLLYPAEPPLSDGPLQEIRVSYQDADVWFLGWNTHWMIIFFILSIAFAFLLRNRFGVTL
jgi:hypothetical protein